MKRVAAQVVPTLRPNFFALPDGLPLTAFPSPRAAQARDAVTCPPSFVASPHTSTGVYPGNSRHSTSSPDALSAAFRLSGRVRTRIER